MSRNQALVINGPGKIGLEERPMPTPGKEEVLIQVQYVALCGSDGKLYEGTYTAPHSYPVVLGHEWVGHVVETGTDVSDLKPGDTVTGDCSIYCGQCPMCGVNRNHCVTIEKRGITVDGGCANYIAVNRRHVYKCPETGDCKPFVLTEPTAVGANGILGRVPETVLNRTERAVVLGAGGIGLLSLLSLAEYPFREIVMVDLDKEKLDMAERFGLDNVRTCSDVSALTESFGLIIEAAGATPTLQACPALAAPMGHIVLLGHQKPAEVDFGVILKKSLTIHASNGSTGGFERALDIIARRQEQIRSLITTTIPLGEAPAFISQKKYKKDNIKVVIALSSK